MEAKKFIFKRHFKGIPKASDFELVKEKINKPKDKEVLFEALFLSVDPYMRPYSAAYPTGGTMFGSQVARVVESKHPAYKSGDLVVGFFGWRTLTVINPELLKSPFGEPAIPHVLPDIGDCCPSAALGVLGVTGNSAWFGLTKICNPKSGEVLVVTGAAGAVGSLVGQMGKILGLTVIGFAGSDSKVKMLKEELKFDFAYNYKTKDINEALKESAPKGVDCYFDNVGGTISTIIMNHMNTFGRVSVCGSISTYNEDPNNPAMAPVVQKAIVMKQLTLSGFIVTRWKNEWFEGIKQVLQFIQEGKLKSNDTIYEGFEKMPAAFIGLFTGENTGKALVKV